MRKRISLLAGVGLVTVMSFAVISTGAFFTDTVSQDNLTFKTEAAGLNYGFCPGLAADCSGTTASLHDLASFPTAKIGPGITGADCMVIQNTGAYALNLTGGISTYTQTVGGMDAAFLVKAEIADSSCNPGSGPVVFGSQTLANAYNAGPQAFGSLAPGGRIYVIWSNSWDSTGNQNGLQNQTITVNTFMTGQTS